MKTTFIKSSLLKTRRTAVNDKIVESFIKKFNSMIKKNDGSGNGVITANDILDNIPTLNDLEFDVAAKLAGDQGWRLTRADDNYQSTTYSLTQICK